MDDPELTPCPAMVAGLRRGLRSRQEPGPYWLASATTRCPIRNPGKPLTRVSSRVCRSVNASEELAKHPGGYRVRYRHYT